MEWRPDGPYYFSARCARAHFDFGVAPGMIQRNGPHFARHPDGGRGWDGRGAGIGYGLDAEAGSEDVTAENPLILDPVHSIRNITAEPWAEGQGMAALEGAIPLVPGCVAFSVFFWGNGHGANRLPPGDVPLCMWFRPANEDEEEDEEGGIPEEVRAELGKFAALPKKAQKKRPKSATKLGLRRRKMR